MEEIDIPARRYPTNTATYKLYPIVERSGINPGEKFRVSLYITGYGNLEANKLIIGFNHPNIISQENPGEVRTIMAGTVDLSTNRVQAFIAGKPAIEHDNVTTRSPIDSVGKTITISPVYFIDSISTDEEYHQTVNPHYLPQIAAEKSYDEDPPIELVINTKSDADPGDYNIPIIFTYDDGNFLKQSAEEVEMHVNTRREQLEPLPTWAGISAVVVAIITLLHQAGLFEWLLDLSPGGYLVLVVVILLCLSITPQLGVEKYFENIHI